MRKVRNIVFASFATATVFFAGIAIACDGLYEENIDTLDCITLDEYTSTSACKDISPYGRRCFDCTQEKFLCYEGWDIVEKAGPTFNCHTPGSVCQ